MRAGVLQGIESHLETWRQVPEFPALPNKPLRFVLARARLRGAPSVVNLLAAVHIYEVVSVEKCSCLAVWVRAFGCDNSLFPSTNRPLTNLLPTSRHHA